MKGSGGAIESEAKKNLGLWGAAEAQGRDPHSLREVPVLTTVDWRKARRSGCQPGTLASSTLAFGHEDGRGVENAISQRRRAWRYLRDVGFLNASRGARRPRRMGWSRGLWARCRGRENGRFSAKSRPCAGHWRIRRDGQQWSYAQYVSRMDRRDLRDTRFWKVPVGCDRRNRTRPRQRVRCNCRNDWARATHRSHGGGWFPGAGARRFGIDQRGGASHRDLRSGSRRPALCYRRDRALLSLSA